jgi:hypothetical protein
VERSPRRNIGGVTDLGALPLGVARDARDDFDGDDGRGDPADDAERGSHRPVSRLLVREVSVVATANES